MQTIFVLLFLSFLVVFFGSLMWIHGDAQLRGKPGILVAILAAVLAWPVSLLVWIALRPPVQPGNGPGGRRTFNLEDFRQQ